MQTCRLRKIYMNSDHAPCAVIHLSLTVISAAEKGGVYPLNPGDPKETKIKIRQAAILRKNR